MTAIDIGSRRELLIDEWLIEEMREVELKLQQPVPREVAIVHDSPWEGNICCYHTVISRRGSLQDVLSWLALRWDNG